MLCGSQSSPIRIAKKIIKLFAFSHKFHSMIAIFILSLLGPGPGKANSELENRIKSNHRTQIILRKAKGKKTVIMSRLSHPTEPFSDTHPVSRTGHSNGKTRKIFAKNALPGNSFRYLIYGALFLKGRPFMCGRRAKNESDRIIKSFYRENTEIIKINNRKI